MTNWATNIIKSNRDTVFLECKFPEGDKAFYILKINPRKVDDLKSVISSNQSYNLESYGKIIESGWGGLPEKYKFN